MKYLKIVIPTIVILLAGTWGYFMLKNNKEIIDEKANHTAFVVSEIPVTTARVTSEKINNDLELIGTFEARKELFVIAEMQGRITRLHVTKGQIISKGQSIASIDDATIQAQLVTARASLQKAAKDVERYKNLLDVGAISQTQYEEVKLGMQNQQSNLTAMEQQLKYTTAKSPMSGVVNEIKLEEGSFANPGTEIASVIDINRLNLIVKLDEKDIVKIIHGQQVNIMTEVYPDVIFTGNVNQIAVQADAARKYEIAIAIVNSKKNPLKAGMYGTVKIPASSSNSETFALTIPRKSVVGSLKQPQVYLSKNGQAVLTNIEVGQPIEDKVVIYSGLTENDEVITTGQINLDNGRAIKVISQDPLTNSINQ